MEKTLWYLLTGMRGGENRVRIIRALSEKPRNANQLSEKLDLDYKTVRHHLGMLENHSIVETGGGDYGEMYFLSDRFEKYRDTFEEIAGKLE